MSILVDSYAFSNRSGVISSPGSEIGQTFTGDGKVLEKAKLSLIRNGATGNAYVRIYAHTGTFGSTGIPTGSVLAESDPVDITSFTNLLQSTVTFNFSGANQITLGNGTHYCLSLYYAGSNLSIGYDGSSPTHAGNNYVGVTADNTKDLVFEVYNTSSPDVSVSLSEKNVSFSLPAINAFTSFNHLANTQSAVFSLQSISVLAGITPVVNTLIIGLSQPSLSLITNHILLQNTQDLVSSQPSLTVLEGSGVTVSTAPPSLVVSLPTLSITGDSNVSLEKQNFGAYLVSLLVATTRIKDPNVWETIGQVATNWKLPEVISTLWNGVTGLETAWNHDQINEQTSVIYDNLFAYDVDFLTYDGYYITTNTDWQATANTETAWKEL